MKYNNSAFRMLHFEYLRTVLCAKLFCYAYSKGVGVVDEEKLRLL